MTFFIGSKEASESALRSEVEGSGGGNHEWLLTWYLGGHHCQDSEQEFECLAQLIKYVTLANAV